MNRTLKLLVGLLAVGAMLAGVAVAASSPSASTGSATSIKTTSAVLNGTINPNGASTVYRFEWGLTNAYGVSSSNKSAGSGTKSVAVARTATQLIPGTTYHYRIDALSKNGAAFGADRRFKTKGNPPPGASTGPVVQLSSSSATVAGVINPNHATTNWSVQYGLTTAYGFQTATQTVAAGSKPVLVAVQLQGLAQFTLFHYRLVARHGTSVIQAGSDQTFLTYPSPRFVPRLSAKTTPRRAVDPPFTYMTSGRLTGARQVPSTLGCTSSVKVQFFRGRRRVGSRTVPILPDCQYSSTITFRHSAHSRAAHLTVKVHYNGNGYLAPVDSRNGSISVG
jgi:hypothetical protein